MNLFRPLALLLASSVAGIAAAPATALDGGALAGNRHRVVVTSDIGGTDPDDYQSMAHVLLYGDVLEIEGLISSPFERPGKDKILEVIAAYEKDFANLSTYSGRYPKPDALRAMTKQGGIHPAPYSGRRGTSEGSEWIVRCARRDDPRPLHVLVWGALEDVAQALHDAPDILPKLRVYYIGGPNKKWGPDAYQYIANNFPGLWMIEANATYRGYFVGGNQEGDWSNAGFVKRYVAGKGALGTYFAEHLGGVIKMGDSPSVNWLLRGTPGEPTWPGWGGRFVRAWERPHARFDRLTTAEDRIEIFGILELVLPLGPGAPAKPEGRMIVTNQSLVGHADGQGDLRFRFCPRDPTVFSYEIRSNVPVLDGKKGQITSHLPSPTVALRPSPRFPNWWTDDPSPASAEGVHHGAKSVSQWREDYLRDFAARMERCARPAALKWGGGLLRQKPAWYASNAARAAADTVLRYQSREGGWPKNTDLLAPATDAALAAIERDGKANTIDNGATTLPIRFLAAVAAATREEKYINAVQRGVDYVLASQYPNGGFPQFYPLRNGYYSRITYNDGAMVGALELLRDIAESREPFGWIDATRRARASDAVIRGIDCILKAQIRQHGRLTAWCAQHDEKTLEPAWGRTYEPPSLSGGESVGIVEFLMSLQDPSPEVIVAVEGAVAWLRSVVMTGQRVDAIRGPDGRTERRLVPDSAAPALWARFYEVGTNRPLYMDRDSKPLYDFMQVGYERRSGYGYHTTAPASLLERDYPTWRARIGKKP